MTGLLGEFGNARAAWFCLKSGDQTPGGMVLLPGEKHGHQAA